MIDDLHTIKLIWRILNNVEIIEDKLDDEDNPLTIERICDNISVE